MLVLAVGISVAGGALLIATAPDPSGLAGAVEVIADDERFESSRAAGATFAMAAGNVLEDARRCVRKRSREHPSCVARSEAAAYLQTLAVVAVTCDSAAVYELRSSALDYLRQLERMDDLERAMVPPEMPALGQC